MSTQAVAKQDTVEDNKTVDVKSIMEEIRNRIREDFEKHKDRRPQFQPRPIDPNAAAQYKAGELLCSEELRYLNENFAFSHTARSSINDITSHRPGFIGKIIVKFKRKLFSLLWDSVLKEYFEHEKNYTANLVRYLNTTAKYIDARDAANFWELIRKIDVDITRVLERIERVGDEQSGTTRSFEQRINEDLGKLRHDVALLVQKTTLQDSQMKVLDSVTRGMESIISRASKNTTASTEEVKFSGDQSYLLLENRYRGSEAEIKDRVSIYPVVYKGVSGPVLEIGGGRGELQLCFKEAGVASYSIDIDEAMVSAGREKGIDARSGDGIKHLREVPDKSLGGIIAIQVVEHLPMPVLKELMQLCMQKVSSGGKVIFETINPQSVLALSSNYFRDPTHVWPLHPDTLSYMMSLEGLKIVEIRKLSPVPVEGGIPPVPCDEYLTPRWKTLVESINQNFAKLHELLFGSQDYCVIAEVP